MPRVKGFLRILKRRPGGPVDPDYGIDEGVDPGYGVDEGTGVDNELPSPPPGIWPPPTISHPVHPIAPGGSPGTPGHLPAPPPGSIWPRPEGVVEGLFIVLAHIPEHGWRWIVIDPDGWPDTLPEGPPVATPKR
jgi:hypothetical protein